MLNGLCEVLTMILEYMVHHTTTTNKLCHVSPDNLSVKHLSVGMFPEDITLFCPLDTGPVGLA